MAAREVEHDGVATNALAKLMPSAASLRNVGMASDRSSWVDAEVHDQSSASANRMFGRRVCAVASFDRAAAPASLRSVARSCRRLESNSFTTVVQAALTMQRKPI
jgi:hypothetical protein